MSNTLVSDPQEIAELFSRQFSALYTKEPNTQLPTVDAIDRIHNSLTTIHFTQEKVIEAIEDLKIDSCPGID